MSHRAAFAGLALGALATALAACQQAPVTGREQLMLVDQQQATSMGAKAWQQIKSEMEISPDGGMQRSVQRIGHEVAAVSEQPNLQWEFLVFDDPTPNAFALPGGKIGVHSGMFKVAKNEDQMAAVLAHEVAHVVARHPSEQMSQNAAIQTVLASIGAGEGAVGQGAALAAKLGTLSFSREHEAEADRVGLTYMARAGYDPRAAIDLWQNMQQASSGGRPPGFLSSHPNPGDRIQAMQDALPEVVPIYRRNSQQ